LYVRDVRRRSNGILKELTQGEKKRMEEYGVFAPLPFEVDLFPMKKPNRKRNRKAKVLLRIPRKRE